MTLSTNIILIKVLYVINFKVNVQPNNMMSITSSKQNFLIEIMFSITKFSSFKLSNLRMQAKLSEGSFV